jgi:hypothetical protein
VLEVAVVDMTPELHKLHLVAARVVVVQEPMEM